MFHELKTHPAPFQAARSEVKTFELRKNDRDFKVNDTLILREFDPLTGYTGALLLRRITYILTDNFELPSQYCIMSMRPLTHEEEEFHAAGIVTQEQRRDSPATSQ